MSEKVTVLKTKHPRYSWVVRWPGPGGKRGAKLFTNKTDAELWAKDRRAELGDVGEAFGSISEPERAAVMFWRSFVASVPDAAPPELLELLQDYSAKWKATRSSVTVDAAVQAYEAAKTAEGLRPLSLQGIRTRCGRFARDFGARPICSITSAEISDWILSLAALRQRGPAAKSQAKQAKDGSPPQVGLLAKRNHRLAISGLFAYAKTRGWVQSNPVIDSAKPKPPKTRPGILRAAEVARFFAALRKAAPGLVAFWAVRFFAGIREQEVLRMDWGMIDLAAKEIHLPDTVAKTGHSRTIKIEPALAAFLSPHAKADGPLVTRSDMARRYHLGKALEILRAEDEAARKGAAKQEGEGPRNFPIPMPANAARHCFATFHLLAFRHAGETALQLGHGGSPEMLHRHYKGIATEAEALAFWAIRPAVHANVIEMDTSAKTPKKPKTNTRKKAR